MKILLQSHNDDAVLFAAYTLLREKPLVITVLRSRVQDVSYTTREAEDVCALGVLGYDHQSYGMVGLEQWSFPDDRPDWDGFRMSLANDDLLPYRDIETAYAPLPDPRGHEHHNRVGEIAAEVFGDRTRYYATYRRGERRTRTEREVPFEPEWPALKLAAMACYRSQITLESTRPWFDDWQREWCG